MFTHLIDNDADFEFPLCSIDGLNTSSIGLLDLRRRLAIIPQDAALFEGTIRDNLDPRHVHDDTELWSVLDHARLKEHVSSMEGGLDAAVHEAGEFAPPKLSYPLLSPLLHSFPRSCPMCLTGDISECRIKFKPGSAPVSLLGQGAPDAEQHPGTG
jgi:hypothetical protein